MAAATDAAHQWSAVQLTLSEFTRGGGHGGNNDDTISHLMAIVSLVPIGVVWSALTMAVCTRQLTALLLLLSLLLNETANFLIKRTLRQPRPLFARLAPDGRDRHAGWGMPSAHAQLCAHLATVVWWHVVRYRRVSWSRGIYGSCVVAVVWLTGALVAYSRVHLEYHSWAQVMAGWVLGVVVGTLLYFILFVWLHKRLSAATLVDSTLSTYSLTSIVSFTLAWFDVHDTVPIPRLAHFNRRVVAAYARDPQSFMAHLHASETKQRAD